MSRCLYVTRPDPSAIVLKNTADQILNYSMKSKINIESSHLKDQIRNLKKIIEEEAERLGLVYYDFRRGRHRWFDVTIFEFYNHN